MNRLRVSAFEAARSFPMDHGNGAPRGFGRNRSSVLRSLFSELHIKGFRHIFLYRSQILFLLSQILFV